MLSRIADSLYWMSRYLERADNTARLLEINLLHMLEAEDALSEAAAWPPLLAINGSEKVFGECFAGAPVTAERVIQFMTRERRNGNCVWMSLKLARENARVVRDRISRDMWEALNELWLEVDQPLRRPAGAEGVGPMCASVRNATARFNGLSVNTMIRGESFGFYLLGTFLERADMTARILDVKYHLLLPDVSLVGSPLDYYHWAALLKSLSGFEAYRRKYRAEFRPIDVAELVILEPAFPRSLRFAVDRMDEAFAVVGVRPGSDTARVAGELRARVTTPRADEIVRAGLHQYLQALLDGVSALDAAVAADFFAARYGAEPCAT